MRPQRPIPEDRVKELMEFLKDVRDAQEYWLRRCAGIPPKVVMDRAAWHTGSRLTLPRNMQLEWLPAYSPECNPAEHLWDMLREKYFCNRLFRSLEHVERVLMEALQVFWKLPKMIQSLTLFPWIKSSLKAV